MGRLLCKSLFHVHGHHVCRAHIPEWVAHVGQLWQPIDAAPWNLYNIVWRAQTWIRSRLD